MAHLLSFEVKVVSHHGAGEDMRTVPSQFAKAWMEEFPNVKLDRDCFNLEEFRGTGSVLIDDPEDIIRVREAIANSFGEIGGNTTFFR